MEATHLFNKLKKYTEWTDEKCFVYANIADSLIERSESVRKYTQKMFLILLASLDIWNNTIDILGFLISKTFTTILNLLKVEQLHVEN